MNGESRRSGTDQEMSAAAPSTRAFHWMFWTARVPVLLAMMVAYPASSYLGAPVGGISRRGAWPERDYI
jgi:hypothetical protein